MYVLNLKPFVLFITLYFSSMFSVVTAEVNETQHAECTISSGNVRATAEASVTRKLEGFCSSDHLSRAFGSLEHRLLNEINHLRAMINLLLPPLYQQHYIAQPKPQLYYPLVSSDSSMTDTNTSTEFLTESQADQFQNESPYSISPTMANISLTDHLKQKNSSVSTTENPIESVTEKQLKFRPVQNKMKGRNKAATRVKTGPRDFEIHKFNNTILSGTDLQIFTYYWKIENFSVKLKSNVTSLASPVFSMAGLYLCVKATLNHLNRDYLYLQLEKVMIKDTSNISNIILKTGDTFKRLDSNESFKHKIIILNQVTPTNDLISHEIVNISNGFLVPNSALLSDSYSKEDNLLIKVVMIL